MFDLLNNGSPDKWYKIVPRLLLQANNYHLRLEVWPSSSNGTLLYSSPSAVQERVYQNNNIGNSNSFFTHISVFGGYRVSNFDNYAMNLQGSTVINQGPCRS